MTENKKLELLNAINQYFDNERFDELDMDGLDASLKKGSIGLAYTTERDYHEVQTEYSFTNECLEYYVDGVLIGSENIGLDDFISVIENADFEGLLEPCFNYVQKMYEPLDEQAQEILGGNVKVYPNFDNGKDYVAIVYHGGYSVDYHYFNDVQELNAQMKGDN